MFSISIGHYWATSPGADYSFLGLSTLSNVINHSICNKTCPSYHCHFVDGINAEDIQLQSDVCSSIYNKQITLLEVVKQCTCIVKHLFCHFLPLTCVMDTEINHINQCIKIEKKDGQSVSTLEFTLTIKKVNFFLESDACMINSSKHSTHKVDIISWKGDHNFVWLKIIIYVSSFHHT